MHNLLELVSWKVTLGQELLGSKSKEGCNSLMREQECRVRQRRASIENRIFQMCFYMYIFRINCNVYLYKEQAILFSDHFLHWGTVSDFVLLLYFKGDVLQMAKIPLTSHISNMWGTFLLNLPICLSIYDIIWSIIDLRAQFSSPDLT